tara:strand:- start:221 stop:1108 length:888 start_codon:yes stop_codon:yes gene_type:complete
LRLEQEIPVELEESIFWLLKNLQIHRFSFEYDPENKSAQVLFVWLPMNEFSIKDQQDLVQSINLLTKPFGLSLPNSKWIQIKNEDWSLSWKKNWKPDPIGKSILILPAWLDVPEKFEERKIIRLDPGSAFGTGSHPSTRLCVEALDSDPPVGKTIADLGCGSGILSLSALQLGAKCTYAVDTDSLAISATKANFALNKIPANLFNIFLGSVSELEMKIPEQKIDLLLCNILAPVIKSLGSSFGQIIGDKGKVILSGLLVDQIQELQEFFSLLAWEVVGVEKMDKWALIVLTKKTS